MAGNSFAGSFASDKFQSRFPDLDHVDRLPPMHSFASSFTSAKPRSGFVDLDYVDRYLQWNPHPRDRELTQRFLWDAMDTIPESVQQCRREISAEASKNTSESLTIFEKRKALEDAQLKGAKRCAGNWARRLAEYHEGRVLLDAEDPGEYTTDSKYWFARAACYRAEYEKLKEEYYDRDSRSVTPGYVPPEFLGETELDRAKGSAEIAAECLATLPTGKALLEAEDHGDSATDPAYWWSKQKYYRAEYWAMHEKTKLERAKRYADCTARDLATFTAGKALLEAEDHGDSTMDPGYWRSKKRYYKTEYNKLEQEYWDRWKHTYLNGEGFPFEALNDSKPKTRARQSLATKERRTTRSTRNTTQRRKETDQIQLGHIASNPKTRDGRSAGRRKSKDRYRHRNAQVAERKPPSPTSGSSATQKSLNGYVTPNSDRPRTRQLWIRNRCKNAAQRRYNVTDSRPDGRQKKSQPPSQPQSQQQPRNLYVTPISPDFSEPKARQRRKYKGAVRQKRRRDADSAYHGSRAASQPQEPISSRLRSGRRSLRG